MENKNTFKCEVEVSRKYKVEFDKEICNEQWMEDFRRSFYDFDDLEEHAAFIAGHRATRGEKFIEGYGVPLENGRVPYWANYNNINRAINIIMIDECVFTNTEED